MYNYYTCKYLQIQLLRNYENLPMQNTKIFFNCENRKFHQKSFDIFKIFAQNIDRGYRLLMSTYTLCFFGQKLRKIGISLSVSTFFLRPRLYVCLAFFRKLGLKTIVTLRHLSKTTFLLFTSSSCPNGNISNYYIYFIYLSKEVLHHLDCFHIFK